MGLLLRCAAPPARDVLLHEHSAGNVIQVSSDASALRVIGGLRTCTRVGDGDGSEGLSDSTRAASTRIRAASGSDTQPAIGSEKFVEKHAPRRTRITAGYDTFVMEASTRCRFRLTRYLTA